MNKTNLIKNAIYKRVKIEFDDDDVLYGWLVPSLICKNDYDLLPIYQFDDVTTFSVSQVKHIYYLDNGYKLW